jgi:hypothetical protein
MLRDEVCVCGHPLWLHRSYGCTGTRPNPDPKGPASLAPCPRYEKTVQVTRYDRDRSTGRPST